MSLVVRGVILLVLMMTLIVPVQADPLTCAAGDPLSALLQDDAGSDADAANLQEAALLLSQGDFTGMLQIPTSTGVGDTSDWYTLQVGGQADRVMAELSAYTAADALASLLVIDVVPPGEATPTATFPLGAERAAFDGVPGEWSFRVRFATAPETSCASSLGGTGAPDELSALTRSYAFYVGCDPICL